jgi:hypothetical protein
MNVIAVIGDIVRSRDISMRESFQARLLRTLDRINTKSRPASAYTLSAGDELEAVYRNGDTLIQDWLRITSTIYPERIRFAVAIGALTTDIHPDNPLIMDGPAFRLARKAIQDLRAAAAPICVVAEPPTDVALENDAARLLASHIAQWKKTRWIVYRRLARGATPAAVSKAMRISSAAVYKNIRAGAIDLVSEVARDLGRSITAKVTP